MFLSDIKLSFVYAKNSINSSSHEGDKALSTLGSGKPILGIATLRRECLRSQLHDKSMPGAEPPGSMRKGASHPEAQPVRLEQLSPWGLSHEPGYSWSGD
jgi:hypothetical protein